ncbi:VOC family protein [Micromonospora sp. NPDC002575]|uniref:VOC family protein n=1 Tax=Micromonospora sp. NPDC002575 TaxID=3364222 RepID=UPI0036950AD4
MTRPGIPGAQRVDHVALTVADLDAATAFVVDVLGGEVVYRLPPLARTDDWMSEHLDVPPRATAEIALIRLGPTTNLELFQYTVAGQATTPPQRHDPGHQHLGFLVADVAEATAAVRRLSGLTPQGPADAPGGRSPLAGACRARFRTPWGLAFELRSLPEPAPHGPPALAARYRPAGPWANRDARPSGPPPITGLRGVDHIGYTVADLDEALAVFADVLGGELLHRAVEADPDGPVEVATLRMGPTDNVELRTFADTDRAAPPPRNCDVGGRHLAVHVRDVDAAARYLAASPGFTVLGAPETIDDGPIAGDRWVYVRSPIGLHVEVVRMPDGALPYERTTAARRAPAGTLSWTDR